MFGLEDMDTLSLRLFVLEVILWIELNEGFLHGHGVGGSRSSSSGVVNRVLSISSSRIGSSGSWVSVIVGNSCGFGLLTRGA